MVATSEKKTLGFVNQTVEPRRAWDMKYITWFCSIQTSFKILKDMSLILYAVLRILNIFSRSISYTLI